MTTIFSIARFLGLTLSFVFYGCTSNTANQSQSNATTSNTTTITNESLAYTGISTEQKNALTAMYTQAIGDYIKLVKKEYNLTFDSLFFGKHANGQPTDFPDIVLPSIIEKTHIRLISPEQGKKHQEENKSSTYINLFGSTTSDQSNFIFVTFSNGFAHQFAGMDPIANRTNGICA